MGISFDPAKSERNERERGLHVISLRKANQREVKQHEQKAQP